jgi:hypothetical protein
MSGWRKALMGSPRLVINVSTGEIVQRMDGVYPAFSGDEFGNVIYDSTPGFSASLISTTVNIPRSLHVSDKVEIQR